jgi:hypothetical protein
MINRLSRFVSHVILVSFIFTFVLSPTGVFSADNKLKTGDLEVYKNRDTRVKKFTATQEQVDALKTDAPPDLHYVDELPSDYNKFYIKIDPKLGGGFLIGDENKIAFWLNKVGITVGLTGAALVGGGDGAIMVVVGLAVLVLLVTATSNQGGGGGGGPVTPTTPTH